MTEILANICTLLIFFSPVIIVVFVFRKIKNRSKANNKTKTSPTTTNRAYNSYNENIDTPQFNPYLNQNRGVAFAQGFHEADSKEDIDEYYDNQHLPYRRKKLLTDNELKFYKCLKPVADEIGLVVLSKIRVADIVEVEPNPDRKFWQTYFNKINRKHIDFALAIPEDLSIVLLIELDDWSHNEHQYERDRFIESVYKSTGYSLLRLKNSDELKMKIIETIKQ